MPGRDDYPNHRDYPHDERRRREMERDPQPRMSGGERRSFDLRGRFGNDEARYGARYDQDRVQHRRPYDEPWRQDARPPREDREPWRTRRPDEPGYGGQEYGIEAHGSDFARSSPIVQRTTDGAGGRRLEERFGQDDRGDPPFRNEPRQGGRVAWRDDGSTYGDSRLDRQDSAIREFGVPHDYSFHPQDAEFEPHYAHWRDEQMRRHDDEYHQWRTRQLRQYDDDYRTWRGERRQAFGETFSQWRNGRSNLSTGTPDTGVAPGVTGQASFGAKQTGFGRSDGVLPSGGHENQSSPTASSPAREQTSPAAGGFARASPAVQKATDGGGGREKDRDETRDDRDEKDLG